MIACLLLFYIWSKLHLSVKTTTSQPFFASIFIYKYLCKLLYSILLYNYNSRDDPPVTQKQKPISGFKINKLVPVPHIQLKCHDATFIVLFMMLLKLNSSIIIYSFISWFFVCYYSFLSLTFSFSYL